jgi:hypothetical protein
LPPRKRRRGRERRERRNSLRSWGLENVSNSLDMPQCKSHVVCGAQVDMVPYLVASAPKFDVASTARWQVAVDVLLPPTRCWATNFDTSTSTTRKGPQEPRGCRILYTEVGHDCALYLATDTGYGIRDSFYRLACPLAAGGVSCWPRFA